MTKSDFNKEAAKEIGALEALASMKPEGKDHTALMAYCEKQRTHQNRLAILTVQYIGNGMAAEMAEDTATKVITYLRDQQQVAMFLTPADIGKEVAKQLKEFQESEKYVRVRGKQFPVSWNMVKSVGKWTIAVLLLLNLFAGRIDFAQLLKFFGLAGVAG